VVVRVSVVRVFRGPCICGPCVPWSVYLWSVCSVVRISVVRVFRGIIVLSYEYYFIQLQILHIQLYF